MSKSLCAVMIAAVFAVGCTSIPTSPSTMALPGTGKSFDAFRHDDGECRQYASDTIGGQTSASAQTESAVLSTVAGAAIGAMIGAAAGGGSGAAVGAGVGGGAGGRALSFGCQPNLGLRSGAYRLDCVHAMHVQQGQPREGEWRPPGGLSVRR